MATLSMKKAPVKLVSGNSILPADTKAETVTHIPDGEGGTLSEVNNPELHFLTEGLRCGQR